MGEFGGKVSTRFCLARHFSLKFRTVTPLSIPVKFLLFTFIGSAFMLVSILSIGLAAGGTFNLVTLLEQGIQNTTLLLPITLVFWFVVIGFSI